MKNVHIVNNTDAVMEPSWYAEIVASIRANGTLPEALADLFVPTITELPNETRVVLNWA